MRYIIILLIGVYTSMYTFSQEQNEGFFNAAYLQLSEVPRGTLEAVSFTNTRMVEIKSTDVNSCSGLPLPYGIMGVFDDGKNYFLENGKLIGKLSGISISQQKESIEMQILAYGLALDSVMKLSLNKGFKIEERLRIALLELSEIPKLGAVNDFARNSFAIEVFRRSLFRHHSSFRREKLRSRIIVWKRKLFGLKRSKNKCKKKRCCFAKRGKLHANDQ